MTEENNVSNWLQDNLRIIISVGIVILLVFAIYSYSQRNSRTNVVVDDSTIEEVATADELQGDEINEIIDEIRDEENITEEVPVVEEIVEEEEVEEVPVVEEIVEEEEDASSQEEIEIAEEETRTAEEVVREVIESRSQQKSGVVTVVAVRGDSATTLARKATSEFISKNSTQGITAAHKIYIEDYLRKMKDANRIHPGTELEFSNEMISDAITKSQTLNQDQLSNLSRYAENVRGL